MFKNKNTDRNNPKTTINRKEFLKNSSLSLLGMGLFPVRSLALPNPDNPRKNYYNNEEKKIRSISYNVFNGCIGYKGINGHDLPEGEDSMLVKAARDMGQIPQRIMLELALYSPNIINFSEGPGEDVVSKMAKILNLNYAFFPGAKNGEGHFPGCILTNYEIVNSENRPFVNKNQNDPQELFTRHWGKAKLRLPGGKTITVHSAHLWPFKKEENDTNIRMNEIKELLNSIEYDLANGSDSVLLQGDLNHTPDMPEYKRLNNSMLIDVFKKAGKGDGFTHSSIKPIKRIDYIYATENFASHVNSCQTLFQGNFRMNNEDPKGYALSDHIPLMADFDE